MHIDGREQHRMGQLPQERQHHRLVPRAQALRRQRPHVEAHARRLPQHVLLDLVRVRVRVRVRVGVRVRVSNPDPNPNPNPNFLVDLQSLCALVLLDAGAW